MPVEEVCVFGHHLNQIECRLIADINKGTELGVLPYTHRCFEISQGTGILAQVPWIIVFTLGENRCWNTVKSRTCTQKTSTSGLWNSELQRRT